MLTVIATPIGNLEDISERALRALKESDAILCEDTRRTAVLLNRYAIRKELISYHKFNEKSLLDRVLSDLEAGKNLALVSDAGTPCINDPGQILVNACIEKGLPVHAIPGSCSIIQALVLSGFSLERFQFLGFLPKNPAETLRQIMGYPGVSVAFESPERLVDTLTLIDPMRRIAVARELTKMYEECRRGSAAELLAHYQNHPPKGEIVLIIDRGESHDDLSIEELVHMLQDLHGMSLKEAIRQAARLKGVPKRDVYRKFHT